MRCYAAVLPLVSLVSFLLTAPCSSAATVYVSRNATGTPDGTSWATAFPSVQAGINAATSGDEVWVASATYVEQITLSNGVALYGGFTGTETARSQRDWKANPTILDGNQGGTVITVPASVIQTATLDGFTVRNGWQSASGLQGGGIAVAGHAVIANNTITGNTVKGQAQGSSWPEVREDGGGVYVSGFARITGNTITGNTADSGGGIYIAGSATIDHNDIRNNRASYIESHAGNGGGICFIGTTGMITVTSNTIVANKGDEYGGGIYAEGGTISIAANIISGNSGFSGGGLYSSSNATIVSNSIVTNVSSSTGGGALVSGPATVANNTIAGNQATDGGGITTTGTVTLANNILAFNTTGLYAGTGTLTLTHNDIFGNASYNVKGHPDPAGTNGNIAADPLFANRANGDYHLASGSPCLDTGDDAALAFGVTDLDGKPRKIGPHIDMGSYEFGTTYFTIADAAKALRLAAGLLSDPADVARLNVEPGPGLDLSDVLRLARKSMGLDLNP